MKINKFIALVLIVLIITVLQGCVANRIFTEIGTTLGKEDYETMQKGTAEIEKLQKSWPYVHGQIKGVMGDYSYKHDLSDNAIEAAEMMDELAKKETLTPSDIGKFYGARNRFGWYWATYIKDKYGAPLWQQVKKYFGLSLPF